MRLRYRIICWLIGTLTPMERHRLCRDAMRSIDQADLSHVIGGLLVFVSLDQVRTLWHQCGLMLNVAKDGVLDLGRPKEGQ